jgi:hypothetical protein
LVLLLYSLFSYFQVLLFHNLDLMKVGPPPLERRPHSLTIL